MATTSEVAQQAAPEGAVRSRLIEAVADGKYHADIHERYHLALATKNARADLLSRIFIIAIGLVGYAGPLVFSVSSDSSRMWWAALGLTFMVVSSILSVMTFATDYKDNSVLAHRWNALSIEWENLQIDCDLVPEGDLRQSVERLKSRQLAIEEASSASYDRDLLAQAQDRENSIRNLSAPKLARERTGWIDWICSPFRATC